MKRHLWSVCVCLCGLFAISLILSTIVNDRAVLGWAKSSCEKWGFPFSASRQPHPRTVACVCGATFAGGITHAVETPKAARLVCPPKRGGGRLLLCKIVQGTVRDTQLFATSVGAHRSHAPQFPAGLASRGDSVSCVNTRRETRAQSPRESAEKGGFTSTACR